VASEFLSAGYKAALLNVEINLSRIKDDVLVAEVREEIERKEKEIEARSQKIVEQVLKRIKK
jgi:formiminotetrahydrofolate cyclodeaminase